MARVEDAAGEQTRREAQHEEAGEHQRDRREQLGCPHCVLW